MSSLLLFLSDIIVHSHRSSILRYCVLLLHPLLGWCQVCLLPLNHSITKQAPRHLATQVSLPLTLDLLKTVTFPPFLSTRPNPQLIMSMLCDRGRKWASTSFTKIPKSVLSKESSQCHISYRNHIVLALSVLVYIVVLYVSVYV